MIRGLDELRRKTNDATAVCKPLLFRPSVPNDREALEQLLAGGAVKGVCDEILLQVQEFVKLRHPEKKFSESDLKQAALNHLGGVAPEDYGVWVYYPWTQRLVHLLDEDEFVNVRTNRNQHKITPEEKARLSQKKIVVLGLSVGQSVALTLAMERGCGELRIADFDVLELSNLNRIRTGAHNLGIAKTVAVAREIAEIDPFFKVTCFHEGATKENLDAMLLEHGKADLLVDECDDLLIKILCRQRAREHGIPVVMDTADSGMLDIERFDLEPERPLFHGIVSNTDIELAKNAKSREEKIPIIMAILGSEISPRLKASMVEIGKSITTWPQLASAVIAGGANAASVSRRILLGQLQVSGRFYIDPERIITD